MAVLYAIGRDSSAFSLVIGNGQKVVLADRLLDCEEAFAESAFGERSLLRFLSSTPPWCTGPLFTVRWVQVAGVLLAKEAASPLSNPNRGSRCAMPCDCSRVGFAMRKKPAMESGYSGFRC